MTFQERAFGDLLAIMDMMGRSRGDFFQRTVHILPHWNWQGSKYNSLPVFVYTNGDCAELFLNEKSQGIKCKNPKADNPTERFRLMWKDVMYEPGELRAVATKESEKIGENSMITTGEATQLRLTPDQATISAGGMDLSYILVEALDKNGNSHPLNSARINISVNGPATIAGVGNGNPQSFESFQAETVDLFFGKAMILLRSGYESGKVEVSVSSENLGEDSVAIIVE